MLSQVQLQDAAREIPELPRVAAGRRSQGTDHSDRLCFLLSFSFHSLRQDTGSWIVGLTL